MRRSPLIALTALLLITALVVFYATKPGYGPSAQPSLVDLESQTAALQADFNRTPGRLRVILLLSPT